MLDLFKQPRQDLSDDERENRIDAEEEEIKDNGSDEKDNSRQTRGERMKKRKPEDKENETETSETSCTGTQNEKIAESDVETKLVKDGRQTPIHARNMPSGESYTHIMCNNNWYIFFRLHHILCTRLSKIYNQALLTGNEEISDKSKRKDAIALSLRLKPKSKSVF